MSGRSDVDLTAAFFGELLKKKDGLRKIARYHHAAVRLAQVDEQKRIEFALTARAAKVPIAGEVYFNGYTQSEFNLFLYASNAVRDVPPPV